MQIRVAAVWIGVTLFANKWAVTPENVPSEMCTQRRYISACAFPHFVFMQTMNTLTRLCGCAGWFEYSLVVLVEDPFSNDAAQMFRNCQLACVGAYVLFPKTVLDKRLSFWNRVWSRERKSITAWQSHYLLYGVIDLSQRSYLPPYVLSVR